MKLLSLCLLLFFTPELELQVVRQNYINAAQSEKSAQDFHKTFESVSENHPEPAIVAYKAASRVL